MAKVKGYKIKRNRQVNRYRSPLSIALRTVLTVALVGGFAFIGWSAYGPISAFLSGTMVLPVQSVVPSPQPEDSAASAPEQTDLPAQESTAPATPTGSQQLRAVFLPAPILSNPQALDQHLTDLTAQGFNAVLFDLKNSAGKVLYRSALPQAAAGITEDAVDLSALCAKLSARGITPIGRLHAFRDPIAADAHRGMSVKYMNTQTLWLDNAANQGGKPWLSAYSTEARRYIYDLAVEAAQAGVKQILLDSVSLPTAYALEYASFGTGAANMSAAEALSTFVEEMESHVKANGAQVSLYLSGLAVLGTQNNYYGGNPLEIAGEHITIGMMPAQFGDAFSCEAPYAAESGTVFTLDKPLLTPYNTVDSLYTAIAPGLEGKTVVAMLQGTTATGAFRNNKVYTVDDINEQVRALAKQNVESYILYSADGIYPKKE